MLFRSGYKIRALFACLLPCWLVMPAFAQPPGEGYQLLFESNFRDGLNESDWLYRTGRRTGKNINGLDMKENVSVNDSGLNICARQLLIDGKVENTGGGIISKHQFGYGYYETLSRPFMGGRGVHSAFWQAGGAQPNNRVFEADSYEIDSKDPVASNNLYVHLSPQGLREMPWPCRANVPVRFRNDGWFLDGYEYTPEGFIFYDNGQAVAKVEWPGLTAAQVVWLTALNGVGEVEPDKQPGTTIFKYFRYYAKDHPGVNILPNGNFEYNQNKSNSTSPICWQQESTPVSVIIGKGNAFRDNYFLRYFNDHSPYHATTFQSLEYIMNGDYLLTAMIRSSGGQQEASIGVSGFGGKELLVKIPASTRWTKVVIPRITVSNNKAVVSVRTTAGAGQWLEIDDIRFFKPAAPGAAISSPAPFSLTIDPAWQIAKNDPIGFSGDEKFYFFDRNVGCADAITVSLTVKAKEMAFMSPIAKMPASGRSGWAVLLRKNGDVVFRIGSAGDHSEIVAPGGYEAGKESRITCVYDHGAARLYINKTLHASGSNIIQDTKDATAAGKLGTVGNGYQAVGDIMVQPGSSGPGIRPGRGKERNFAGTVQKVEVYNRALTTTEIVNQ